MGSENLRNASHASYFLASFCPVAYPYKGQASWVPACASRMLVPVTSACPQVLQELGAPPVLGELAGHLQSCPCPSSSPQSCFAGYVPGAATAKSIAPSSPCLATASVQCLVSFRTQAKFRVIPRILYPE